MALPPKTTGLSTSKEPARILPQLGYGAAILTSLLYGGNIIVARVLTAMMPPLALSVVRGALGLLVLVPFTWRKQNKPAVKDLPYLALLGFLGISLPYSAFAWSMQTSPAANAAIIIATFPAVTLVLLAIGWQVKPTRSQVIGIALSFGGLLLLSTRGSLEALMALHFQAADLLLLVNVVALSLYNILGQKIMDRYSPRVTSTYSLFFGTLFLLPGGLWEITTRDWQLSWWGWLLLVYMGCIIAGLAVLLNLEAIYLIGCVPMAILNNLNPLFAIALAALLLKENLYWYHWLGAVMVLSGVMLSILRNRQS